MEERRKITSFTDLVAWKESHKLVLVIYRITKTFPKEEQYSLTDQMRRASISISSNIAEAFSRGSKKEKNQFYSIALGSLTELQNQILVARDIDYFSNNSFQEVAQQTVLVSKLIRGLIKTSHDR